MLRGRFAALCYSHFILFCPALFVFANKILYIPSRHSRYTPHRSTEIDKRRSRHDAGKTASFSVVLGASVYLSVKQPERGCLE
jgi:hypothetical protein